MLFQRESGVLLHPTSLPGPHGTGEIGPEALRWLDALAEMGQRLWQILPLGPTGLGASPYQSPSTFACAPSLISLDALAADGLLDAGELAELPSFPAERVDFERAAPARDALLRRAAAAFPERAGGGLRRDCDAFRARSRAWLDDWALFQAIKQAQDGRSWTEWPAPLRDRDGDALERARAELRPSIEIECVLQFLFARQWQAVRTRARQLGIRLLGDIAIFVAHDSADVWQRRDLFELDERGQATVVAGVPPDYFSDTGQRWGNPLYRWPAHAADDYAWWGARVARALELVDLVRIDHFRGFEAYWEIPASEPTAIHGRWLPGPGAELFHALRRRLGDLPILAEDLGLITEEVAALRDGLGLPGMRVLQFAFGDDRRNPHLPGNYVESCVAYSGTHDNDTLAGWLLALERDGAGRERARLRRYLRLACRGVPADPAWACIEILLHSRAGAVVVPLQDVLGLGGEARMNTPGRAEGNWAWRFRWEQLGPEVRRRLAEATRRAGRNR